MKKRTVLTVFAMILALFAAGCKNGTEAGKATGDASGGKIETAAVETKEDAQEDVNMTVAWWGNQVRNDRTTKVLDMYSEENPYVTIDAQFSEYSDYWNKLATASAGSSLPDIIQMDYLYIQQYVDNGLLLDLSPYIEDGTLDLTYVDENIQEAQKIDGKTYAISLGTISNALFYNKTLLDGAGITIKDNMTLDEFVEICREVKEKTGYRTDLGYGVSVLTEVWLRTKDEVMYQNGRLGASSAANLQTIFDLEKQGMDEGWHLDPSVYAELTLNSVEQRPLVYGTNPDRMSWCTFGTSNEMTAFTAAAPEGMEIGITTWPSEDPQKSNYLRTGPLLAVSADCENPKQAVRLINWILNSEECNKVLLDERGVPASKKIGEVIAPYLDDVSNAVVNYINNVVSLNSTPINPPAAAGANEVYDIQARLEEQVLYGLITPEEAAKQLFEEGNEAMKRAAE